MLYDNGVMTKVLGIEELERLESEKKIDWPTISEKEIRDKSKGDFFSKGFAVLQTTWFTLQCITRHIIGLNITQLELATLAFAVLNIISYILWWDKPLGVACSVPVHFRHPTTSEASLEPPLPPFSHHHPSAFACFCAYFCKKFKEKGLFAVVYIFLIKPFMIIVDWVEDRVFCNIKPDSPAQLSVPTLYAPNSGSPNHYFAPLIGVYIFLIKPFMIIVDWVEDMVLCDTIPDSPAQFSVPTLYAPNSPNHYFAPLIGLIVGVVFGGIHCIAWSFGFPSVPEEYIWRVSAVAITTIPFILSLAVIAKPTEGFPHDFFDFLEGLIVAFSIPLYCLSRAALLILPFLALRSLPPGSLLDFKWSSLIPHI